MLRSDCSVYFDAPRGRLVYVGQAADEGYWDGHWLSSLTPTDIRKPDRFVASTTERYLSKGSRVIDAGCGLGRTVFGLQQAGFDAYGIDFAPDTVATINRLAPELKVSVADVRDMSAFPDAFFDGLWSLGVIEHFYRGYDQILQETFRVLQPGGYAFVTVPAMSPLRKLKAALGSYGRWQDQEHPAFYQFVLPARTVIADFGKIGFELVRKRPLAGFKGLKDEMGALRPALQKLYDSQKKPFRALRHVLDSGLNPFSYHTQLFIFRKTKVGTDT